MCLLERRYVTLRDVSFRLTVRVCDNRSIQRSMLIRLSEDSLLHCFASLLCPLPVQIYDRVLLLSRRQLRRIRLLSSRSVSRMGCRGIYVTNVCRNILVGLHMKLCTFDSVVPPTSFPVDSFDAR
jgi:hypothetical protein